MYLHFKNGKHVDDNYIIPNGWTVIILPNFNRECNDIIFGQYKNGLLNGTAYIYEETLEMSYPDEEDTSYLPSTTIMIQRNFKDGVPVTELKSLYVKFRTVTLSW